MFDWITGFIQQSGYFGIALLMLLENVFPPIPSEMIMPLAGFTAEQGRHNLYLVVLAGTVGSLLGAVAWYYVGRWVGCERLERFAGRHGRWLTLAPDDIEGVRDWFGRHGGKTVFLGRLIPAIRTVISIPAGLAAMPMGPFLLYSTAGTLIWTALLAGAGYLLGEQYHKVATYAGPVANAVFAAIVLWYLYRVVTWRARKPS